MNRKEIFVSWVKINMESINIEMNHNSYGS